MEKSTPRVLFSSEEDDIQAAQHGHKAIERVLVAALRGVNVVFFRGEQDSGSGLFHGGGSL